jgi:hypothetical protein
MFLVGDVLIKVDRSSWVLAEFDTRHHAMLVVDVSKTGHPIVAHMKVINFETNTGNLVIESCPKCRDVVLIRATTFSEALRQKIAAIAQEAHQLGKLKIGMQFLAGEYRAANSYRWGKHDDGSGKLESLYEHVVQPKDVLANTEHMISCHDFVLSTIQHACHALGESVPRGFNIAPSLAWSDILHACCGQDETLHLFSIESLTSRCPVPNFEQRLKFFKRNRYGEVPSKAVSWLPSCVMM